MRCSSSFFFVFPGIYVYKCLCCFLCPKSSTLFYSILQSSFFAHFLCFEVPALLPPEGVANGKKVGDDKDDVDDDLGIMDIDENDNKAGTFSYFLHLPSPVQSL